MNTHTPGPVETLARLAIQSDRYANDEEFRIAVDAVIGKPVFDAAPDVLVMLEECAVHIAAIRGDSDPYAIRAFALIAKATGSAV